jgi:hypothetical protein
MNSSFFPQSSVISQIDYVGSYQRSDQHLGRTIEGVDGLPALRRRIESLLQDSTITDLLVVDTMRSVVEVVRGVMWPFGEQLHAQHAGWTSGTITQPSEPPPVAQNALGASGRSSNSPRAEAR